MPVQRVTLQPKCPECGKSAVEIFRYKDKETQKTAIVLKCGHITVEEHVHAREDVFFESIDGYRPFDFQEKSAKFAIETAGCRVLFAHEPGLGKTICAFRTLSMLDAEEAYPCIWVVKSSLIPQFFAQIVRWLGYEHIPQVIERGTDIPFKGFKHYIVSYDMLPRLFKNHGDTIFSKVEPKTLVLDECQMIKNFGAKRTKALYKLSMGVKNIMALSGTPILNNATEYFPVLHLLRPAKFPTREGFLRYWFRFVPGRYNQILGLKNPDRFQEYTSDFIIRYKKEEVLKDLPKLNRGYQYCNMDDELQEAYNQILKEFGDAYRINPGMKATNILAWMSKMRHLTGLSKINNTIEDVIEHLENTDRKMVVFHHHIDVGDLLVAKLEQYLQKKGWNAVHFLGGMKADDIKHITDKFQNDPNCRVMVASTLAAGEGLNLQFCSDCILHERQWNPPKEDQAFDRFHRIGQVNPVNANIMIALGTIDEILTQKVDGVKRQHLKEALDNEEYHFDETALAHELAEAMAERAAKLNQKAMAQKQVDVDKIVNDKIDQIMKEEKFVKDLENHLMDDVNGDDEENGND